MILENNFREWLKERRLEAESRYSNSDAESYEEGYYAGQKEAFTQTQRLLEFEEGTIKNGPYSEKYGISGANARGATRKLTRTRRFAVNWKEKQMKQYYEMFNIGRSKYVVNFHDGIFRN